MPNPKTIQIFCPTGEPRGVRIAEITTSIVQAVVVPRPNFDEALKRPELGAFGVYFLFGPSDESDRLKLYFGEADDCASRLRQHAASPSMDFWQLAVAIVSSKQSLTKAHGRLLEHWAVLRAREAGRYEVVNGNSPGKPPTPESMEAESQDVFEIADTLLGTLGLPVFERLGTPSTGEKPTEFLCTQSADARGIYSTDGFVVFKGSFARGEIVPSMRERSRPRREQLISEGVLVPDGSGYRFSRDYAFGSPSGAAAMVMGASTNGWLSWVDAKGRTLNEIHGTGTAE